MTTSPTRTILPISAAGPAASAGTEGVRKVKADRSVRSPGTRHEVAQQPGPRPGRCEAAVGVRAVTRTIIVIVLAIGIVPCLPGIIAFELEAYAGMVDTTDGLADSCNRNVAAIIYFDLDIARRSVIDCW